MAVRDMMTLKNAVTVGRVTESVDSMGNVSSSTVTTTLTRAALWQAGSANIPLSDKIARDSTHVLAMESSQREWVATDDVVTYDSNTYRVTGRPDDVFQRSELTVVGLELIE